MIAIIFEVWPEDGQKDAYLSHATTLRPIAEDTEGFLGVERFQSLTNPDKLLSVSFFEDEAAVARWREQPIHRAVQSAGRKSIFRDYRLRVAQVLRDYGMTERDQAPSDSQAHHGAGSTAPE